MENNIKALIDKGVEAFNASKFQQAIHYFSQVLDIKPDDTLSLGNRAIAYRQLGEFDNALKDISTAIVLQPEQALFYSTKAAILTKLHKQLEAVEELDKALALEPLVEYAINKVIILKKLNRFQDALRAIESIESQNLDSEELQVYKGVLLFDIGKNAEALKVFQAVSDPKFKTIANHYISEINKTQN